VNVILLDRIHKLGNLGEQVNVKAGYGRNYLIPQGKAVPANAKNIALYEAHKAELELEVAAKVAEAKKRAVVLEGMLITIPMLVGEDDKLYGSVGVGEIVDAIKALGAEVAKQEVQLPNGPIRTVGEQSIEIHMHHGDVIATVKVSIIPQA
jgi:large subunit ribosomal protein L9